MRFLILVPACLILGACSSILPLAGSDAGNPDHFAYAGATGSVYDSSANPAQPAPMVAYNPEAPIKGEDIAGENVVTPPTPPVPSANAPANPAPPPR